MLSFAAMFNDNYSSRQCQLEITSLPAWFDGGDTDVTLSVHPFGGTESLAPEGDKDAVEPKGWVGAPG